ncbi:unnamed protein product [Brachionus calyciflorus]|uniref:Thioredoxin domain-containing protein n=1 Tax=Brachionus calyciflorus TaxID=104777 RepID=A0A814I739_9BILA|nr:unnamed protein product [Brachionus calyciflorus]
MSVIHVHESDKFKELISTGVSLVDFSASWCGPCKLVEPVFKNLAKENPSIKFIHIDVDDAAESMEEELEAVSGVPHFELYHNGEKISQFAGANLGKIKESVETLKSKLEASKPVEEEEKKEESKEEVITNVEKEEDKNEPKEDVQTGEQKDSDSQGSHEHSKLEEISNSNQTEEPKKE